MQSVTAVVVTYNSADVLPDFLDSLPQAMEAVGAHEVVVVDNDSVDDTVEVVHSRAPGARVVAMGRNAGYAAGVNAGAEGSSSDAILVLNPDVRLQPGSVRRMLDTLREPGTGIAVPKLVSPDGHLHHSLRREPTVLRALGEAVLGGDRAGRYHPLGEMIVDPGVYERPGVADWATGAVMLISRACLDTVGPWDESFFLYSEETDFALRARDAGFALRYEPRAVAVHIGGEAPTSPRLSRILTRNRVRLYAKRNGRVAAAAFFGAVVLNEALRASLGSPTHRAGLKALFTPRRRLRPRPAQPGYICFAAQDFWYHSRAHSDVQLMLNVARDRTVLLVNSIGMRMPSGARSTQPLRRVLRKARSIAKLVRRPIPGLPNFTVMSPFVVPLYGNPRIRALNAALVRAQVRTVARALGIADPVIVVTIPTAWDVVAPMPRRSLVYNRSDRHSAFPEADRAVIEELEGQLLRHADHVLYVSRALLEEEAELTGDRATFLDHGVDLQHFHPRSAAEEPADLAAIPRPRLGFFGALDDYLVDFDLLKRLALEIPEAQLVLIGHATASMDGLDSLPNVHWLGPRPYEEIPRYGSGFDVALMPWLRNDWIRVCNPIKLKEYLALGLPVVSTDFLELRRYTAWVESAQGPDQFVARTRRLLQHPDPGAAAARRGAVADASWRQRAFEVIALAEGEGAQLDRVATR